MEHLPDSNDFDSVAQLQVVSRYLVVRRSA